MTLDDVIRRAYRLAGYLKADDEPRPSEFDNALLALQSVYYDVLVQYASLTAVRISAAYTAVENVRVFDADDVSYTVTLPETIADSDATDGYRPPNNGAIVEIAGSTHQVYIYVAHYGAWKRLQGLAVTDAQPLGPAHDSDVCALLAVRLASELPVQIPASTIAMAEAGKKAIRHRFRQTKAVTFDPVLTRAYRTDLRV